jgi:hypothetical protein
VTRSCDEASRLGFMRHQGGWFRLPDGRPDPLWEALRERCGAYLRENAIDPKMGWPCFLYCVGVLTLLQPTMYYWGYLSPNVGIACASAGVMGVAAWTVSRIGHDGAPVYHFRMRASYVDAETRNGGG